MSILSTIGAEFKALTQISAPRDLFSRQHSFGLGGALVQESARLDLDRLVGDPLHNGVVAACVNAIARALPDAPLVLEQRTPAGWRAVDDHPALQVLRAPNPDHSDADVWGLTSGYKVTRGQAFWLLLPNARGGVGEIHVWNPDRITVLGSETEFIAGYRVQRENGIAFEADKRQVIHFRHLPDFNNPRLGWSPLRTARSQIAGDNVSAGYHTSILFNAGVVSLLISLKDGAATGQVTPDQFQTVLTNIRRAGRERAGGIEGINLPLEVHKLAYSPDEMNVDKLIEYYETRICSVMGVSQRVAGLGSDPTYNNLSEALNDFWERRIVPDRNADAATLNRQWLPLFDLDDGHWRFRFDYSNVPALQENRDALHERVRSDWEKGLVDKQQARAILGYATENDGQFARVFYGEKAGTGTEAPESEFKVWEEAKHPRDKDGRFTDGFGGASSRTTGHSAGHLFTRGAGQQTVSGVSNRSESLSMESSSDDGLYPYPSYRRSASSPPVPPVRGPLNPLQSHLANLLLNNHDLSRINKETFSQGLVDVVSRIPPHLHVALLHRVKEIQAFNSIDLLLAKAVPNLGVSPNALAVYDPNKRCLWIDGAHWHMFEDGDTEVELHTEMYAHELTHGLDVMAVLGHKGNFGKISASPEWKRAYALDKLFLPGFSYNFNRNEEEGFAEVGQVLYSTPDRAAALEFLEEHAPNCLLFWKKNRLFL